MLHTVETMTIEIHNFQSLEVVILSDSKIQLNIVSILPDCNVVGVAWPLR